MLYFAKLLKCYLLIHFFVKIVRLCEIRCTVKQ